MINMENQVFKYFIGTPRKHQDQLVKDLHSFLNSENRIFLFQGACGLGKERAISSQIMDAIESNLFKKVFWLVPTNEGKINIEKELGIINSPNKNVLVLHNKDVLCNLKEFVNEPDFSVYDISEKLHKELHKKFNTECPYYIQLEKVKDANIIVCDYNYIIDFNIRKAVFKNIEPEDSLLIFNETHLLPDRCRDVISRNLSTKEIDYALKELENYEKDAKENTEIREFLNGLKYTIERMHFNNKVNIEDDRKLSGAIEGKARITWNSLTEDFKDIEQIVIRLKEIGENISKWKVEKKTGVRSWCFIIGRFLESYLVYSKYESSVIVYYVGEDSDEKKRRIFVGYNLLDPFFVLKRPIEDFKKMIFYSATLYYERYIKLFRLEEFGNTFTPEPYKSPFSKDNRLDIIYKTGYALTKENREKSEVITKIADELSEAIKHFEKPIAVFSVNPLLNLVIPKMSLDGFKVLRETLSIPQKERKEFMEKILQNDVIFLSNYGVFSSSIDLSGIKTIVILGMPIPKMEMIRREMLRYFTNYYMNKGFENARVIAYNIVCKFPTVERCVQASGRGLRNENDKITVVWWDDRWRGVSDMISNSRASKVFKLEELIKNTDPASTGLFI